MAEGKQKVAEGGPGWQKGAEGCHPDSADLRWHLAASTAAEVKGAMSRWATGKARGVSTFLVAPLSVALKRLMCRHSTGGSCLMDSCLLALRWHWHLQPHQDFTSHHCCS